VEEPLGFRISDFVRTSDFGFRFSGLGLTLVCLHAFATTAFAQAPQREPRIGYVYPAGARQDSTSQIVVGGQFLEGVTNVLISGKGAQGVVVDFNRPMNQGVFNNLRDRLKELQDRKQAAQRDTRRGAKNSTNIWTAADEKTMTDIRERMLKNPPNRNATVAIADVATLRVTVAAEAEPGERELRLITPTGLTNPLKFYVGQLPEFSDPPAKAANPDAERFRERFGRQPTALAAKVEPRITLPATINGQISPGEVDRFRFSARKGQQLVAEARARDLIPYLADAVPGWFQATLALHDAKGNELSYADDYRFHPDPVLRCEIPKDGEYVLEIKDSIYRGREDFVYRITVGELPFVTSIFPLGGPAGQATSVEVRGWNLPVTNLTVEAKAKEPALVPVSVRKGERVSNQVPFAVGTLPEVVEKEGNNTPATAQKVVLPVTINGRLDQAGDTDVFRVEGRAGDRLVAEVCARRLDSPLDSVLKLTDASGRQLAFNDDSEDKASGLNTHHADSYLAITLPADGTYFIHLSDTQRQGGADFGYRLRISPPQPDFELRVVPASISVRPGASATLTVYALRKDGFTNDISLVLSDAPAGFKLGNGQLSGTNDQVKVTLTAPFTSQREPASITLAGRAIVDGDAIMHPAVPASDMMQAFFYRHLVPAQNLEVAVLRPGRLAGQFGGFNQKAGQPKKKKL
jgi:hypothetical protein